MSMVPVPYRTGTENTRTKIPQNWVPVPKYSVWYQYLKVKFGILPVSYRTELMLLSVN
ncbi:hypothetical protein HanRHA438_Chr11g0493951 [Helianthus annuus]|nr:hypothetical protein HanPI659440_Chr11g0413641 [Helianthus annuus]KAJ0869879.1 hypothetical protein HanRHA438_Chr11g0493951 [Helianthus annuus]